jgi:hypothetical protein
MLELPRPLMRVLDGPGLIVQRLTGWIPQELKNFDADELMRSMAESDPEYLTYFDSEGLLHRARLDREKEASPS